VQLTDVMATHVISVSPETEIREAARRMIDSDIGAAVVLDSAGELVGVITERDLLRCVSEGVDGGSLVDERMTRHVLTGSPATSLAEAMALMVDGHFRHLPVVNEDGRVIGLVSMRDLMAYTSLRLRGGPSAFDEDDIDPAELLATIHRMRTGAN
jgi:CBS domain-containing protein